MKTLEQLISELCPDGVEYKKLGEVAEISRGKVFSKKYIETNIGNYPVYSSQTLNNGELGRISTYMFDGKYITWTTDGANAGTIFRRNGKFNITNICGLINVIDNNLNIDFLYYWLTISAKRYVHGGSGNPKLMSNIVKTIEIPIPPLAVQEKIVEILDKFTSLTAELQAELQARQQQYEYYRDRLLSFGSLDNIQSNNADDSSTTSGWQLLKMKEIGEFIRGNGLQKKDFSEEGIGCIHYGQIYTRLGTFATKTLTKVPESLANKLVKVNKGDIVITNTSENIDDVCKAVAWLGDEEIVIGGHSCVFKHNQNPKFIAYWLQTKEFTKQKRKAAQGVKVIDVKISDLEDFEIPVPPLAEQERIVGILDRFEALVSDISTGLPAEIAARQQQYEYYRDRLLTFNRKIS